MLNASTNIVITSTSGKVGSKVKIGIVLAAFVLVGLVISYLVLAASSPPQSKDKNTDSSTTDTRTNSPSVTEDSTQPTTKQPAASPSSQTPSTKKPTPATSPSQPAAPAAGGSGSTPTPPAQPTSDFPNASNSGLPSGTSLTTYTGPTYNNSSDLVLDGYNLTSTGGYAFAGNNVTIRNSQIASNVVFYGDNVLIERSTVLGAISLSGTAGATVRYNQVKEFTSDGMHITSDTGQVSGVSLISNYVHTPTPGCGAHADGLQVRGVNGLTITNNTFDMGPWKLTCGADSLNAAIFFESANGGNSNISVTDNYLNGGGYILRIDPGANQTFTGNAFGADGYYGEVLNSSGPGDIVNKSGNYFLATGSSITF